MTEGQVIRCKAALAWQTGGPIVVEDVEVAPPKTHEVRVKVIATGVCHSDLNPIYRDDYQLFPIIPGHESSGIVESVGEGVVDLDPGDHVLIVFKPQCGDCRDCSDPMSNICMKAHENHDSHKMEDGTFRTTCRGQGAYQDSRLGSCAQYTTILQHAVVKIDKRAPLEKVCLIACCFPTGYGAAVKAAKVQAGRTCAVWGMGAVGLSAVMGCKASEASMVIGVDTNPDKKEKALQFGCTHFVNPRDYSMPVYEVIREMTGGRGVDYALDCTGITECVESALEACRVGGGVCVGVGVYPKPVEVPPKCLLYGKTITGCRYGGYRAQDEIPGLVDLYMQGALNLDQLITGYMPLARVQEAVDQLREGKSLRNIIKLHED